MLRVIFWVVPRYVVFNNRRLGKLCLFHLHRRLDMKCHSVPKRRLLNTTRRGTTQNITSNIQNTAKA
jgi:hypothetical protein